MRTHPTRLALGLIFLAVLPSRLAMAREPGDPADARDPVDQWTRDLRDKLTAYQDHLQKAMELYGHGFYDPDYRQTLAGFDPDIRTGNPTQTEKIKRAVFASLLITAGIHLDPDPLHDWAQVEKSLDRYAVILERAVGDAAAARNAEKERKLAESLRPVKLAAGQTFAGETSEGANLHFVLWGIEVGREMGNVNSLIQLTYSGPTHSPRLGDGHMFLLTALAASEEKTRTDTWVRSRALLVFSNPEDSLRYGHAITAQDHGDYRVLSARVADVAPRIHDWIWKSLATRDAEPASLFDLDSAVRNIQDSRHALDAAIGAFQQLALNAVRENDRALTVEASASRSKVQLPEQDLKLSSPDVRARLYAVRALSAGDPRFLAALDAVNAARSQAEAAIGEGKDRFGYFNGMPAYTAPEVPWKNVQRLAIEFMNVAEDSRRAAERANEILPQALSAGESTVTFRPNVIVAQASQAAEQGTSLVSERILREVHWAVKGIPRREYSSQVIEVSAATGVHRVQSVAKPVYIQGPGGVAQVFQHLPETRASTF